MSRVIKGYRCAIIVSILGASGTAIAQSPPVRPQYYSYELNPDPATTSYVYDDRFTSVIRVQLFHGDTAEDAGRWLRASVELHAIK